MFNLNPSKIDWQTELGAGSFASIFPYQKDKNDQKWVIKKQTASSFKELLMFIQEIVLGFSFEHQAILPVRGYVIEEGPNNSYNVYMKMPRMKKTLKTLIDQHKAEDKLISEEFIIKILYNLANGLEYLEKKRIAHRDIKPANILLGEEEEIKLADIGVAKFEAEDEKLRTLKASAGTPYYLAPELDIAPRKMKDLFKGDIWSLGIVIIETCLLRSKIMPQTFPLEQKEQIIKVCISKIREAYSESLADLIADLVHFDPKQRKSAKEICQLLRTHYQDVIDIDSSEKNKIEGKEENKEENAVFTHGGVKKHKKGGEEKIDSFSAFVEMQEEKEKSKEKDFQSPFNELDKTWKELQERWKQSFTIGLKKYLTIKVEENVTDDKIKNYSQEFCDLLKNQSSSFQAFSADFEDCQHITEHGFNEFANVAQFFPEIEKLNLVLNKCHISNKIFDTVIPQILHAKSRLESLSLNCAHCDEISDQELVNFAAKVFEELKTLKQFSVNFNGCSKISDEGFKKFVDSIKSLHLLQEVSLYFQGCQNIKESSKIWAKIELGSCSKSFIE